MPRDNTRPRLRSYFLLTMLACLVGLWLHQRTRYWSVNRFAAEASRRGAAIEGDYDSATSLEQFLERHVGIQYPSRLNRIHRIDMLSARDIDGLISRIELAADVECLKIGPGLSSPDSLEPIGRLAYLTDLIIVARNCDDRWLDAPVRAPQLRRVSVRGGRITDDGLRRLAGVRLLRMLWLPDSQVTDAGVAFLAQSQGLVELDLRGSAITDASVPVLESLPNLAYLNVVGTKISAQGVERLRAAGIRRFFH